MSPRVLDLKVGKTIDLGQVVAMRALNPRGEPLSQVWFRSTVTVGADRAELAGAKLTGRAPGTAMVSIAASLPKPARRSRKAPPRCW